MPRVGLLQITKLLKWLTLAGYLQYVVQGIFYFLFWALPLPTHNHPPSRLGVRVHLTPFLGLSRSFQTPSTTAVSYVRVFPPRPRHNLICRSRLSLLSSYICFVGAISLWCCSSAGAGSLTLQGVNPGRSRAQASNHCTPSGRDRIFARR